MQYNVLRHQRNRLSGFTLIEMIIGIVTFAIVISIATQLIAPTERQSADNIHQIKAAELGQSLMDEILGRAFDENSDMVGGRDRCDDAGQTACTVTALLGPEDGVGGRADENEDTRDLFDDVDDYKGYSNLTDATNNSLHKGYDDFEISVDVEYDGAALGLTDSLAKRITITVTTPLGTKVEFAAYKANF